MVKCYGYARRSTELEEQAESLSRQTGKIMAKFEELHTTRPELDWGGLFQETESATRVRWYKRPQCNALFSILKKNDVLLVENLQRLERNGMYQVACLTELLKKGVHLWDLDSALFPEAVPMGTHLGQTMILAVAMQTSMWGHSQSEGRKRKLQALKDRNDPYCRFPPLGFKWGLTPEGKSRWEPDFRAREWIRECVYRHLGCWHECPGKKQPYHVIGRVMVQKNAVIAGSRGATNNECLQRHGIYAPPEDLIRPLARIKATAKGEAVYTKVMRYAVNRYIEDFNEGFEFKIPLEEILTNNPNRRSEIEYLKRILANHHKPPKKRPKRFNLN